jgi:hypothetical protein
MAGIDKIFLTDYDECRRLEQFVEKHNQEFFDNHGYWLSNGLYDGITPDTFKDGKEHPVSNFGTAEDVFIIQHLSDGDIKEMPNVVERLRQQYGNGNYGFDLIREHKSEYDTYQIDHTRCRIKLVNKTCNKTLKHIKRERWECVIIDVYTNKVKKTKTNYYRYFLDFDYSRNEIYNKLLGCMYARYIDDDSLYDVSMKQVCNYITRTRLKRNTEICVRCINTIQDNKEAEFRFVVI